MHRSEYTNQSLPSTSQWAYEKSSPYRSSANQKNPDENDAQNDWENLESSSEWFGDISRWDVQQDTRSGEYADQSQWLNDETQGIEDDIVSTWWEDDGHMGAQDNFPTDTAGDKTDEYEDDDNAGIMRREHESKEMEETIDLKAGETKKKAEKKEHKSAAPSSCY